MGRHSSYTEAKADAICARIAEGDSLRTICAEDGPDMKTVMRWLSDNEAFRQQYARAREAQADLMAEDILSIADEEVTMVRRSKHTHRAKPEDDTEDNEVEVVFDPTAVARNRLRVDARKWLASKLAPKKYGEKIAVGGADDLPPIQSETTFSDAQLAAIATAGSR